MYKIFKITAVASVLFLVLCSVPLFAEEQPGVQQQIQVDPVIRSIYTAIGLGWLLPAEAESAPANSGGSRTEETSPEASSGNSRVSITGTRSLFAEKRSGKDFFGPSNGRDFFDSGNITDSRKPLPSIPGAEPDGTGNGTEGDDFYNWSVALQTQADVAVLMDNYGYPPFMSLNLGWAPVPHLGLGASFGLLVSEYVPAMYGPGGYAWDIYFSEQIEPVDESDYSDHYAFYRMSNGIDYLFKIGLEADYFLNGSGLEGLYAGLESGIMVTPGAFEAYLKETHEQPVQHIKPDGSLSDEVILPVVNWLGFYTTPNIGYKLIFYGMTIDARFGWKFSNIDLFNGIDISINLGHTF